jgi:hypothetical protein
MMMGYASDDMKAGSAMPAMCVIKSRADRLVAARTAFDRNPK